MIKYLLSLLFVSLLFFGCENKQQDVISDNGKIQDTTKYSIFENLNKPYTRYWWFASEIKKEDVKWNLDWLKENGFGGVEIAWVYPLNRNSKTDSSYTPRYEWLRKDWQDVVDYTIRYADSIGLGCDLTFGTLWPFGDSFVPFEQATQKFGDTKWRQKISASWEYPKEGYVIDHLTPANYQPYFDRLLKAFPRPKTRIKQAYFIDSWEVETEKLWSSGFAKDFEMKYNYDIVPEMDSIYSKGYEGELYDYMSLISDKVLQFYGEYTSYLNSEGILSRGQVSGAPCDLISGYAKLDIPEGEAMLYEPEFNAIPASAALLAGKKVVTAETFTCLYGWPRDYIREEQTADLKLLADALIANGINHVIWHGKAHNPKGQDTVNFYASTHIGFSGSLAPEIPAFNKYLENVSGYMKMGRTYSKAAVYLPTEDAWRKGYMPKDKQFKWAWGYYEMRYIYFPEELAGYSPTWINADFLSQGRVVNGKLIVGELSFDFLYIDAEFLDIKALKLVDKFASEGLKIILKRQPKSPGAFTNTLYNTILSNITMNPNVNPKLPKDVIPLITSKKTVPKFWSRIDANNLYIFFPNPKSNFLKFPIEYGQSLNSETFSYDITINYFGKQHELKLNFEPYQSLLFKIENNKLEQIDIRFVPKTPLLKARLAGYEAPWLVK